MKILTAKDLIDLKITKVPMLLEGIFPKTGIVALAGSSDTGKSSLLRQLAIAICNGDKLFLGYILNTSKNAVTYLATEDDKNALAASLGKLKIDTKTNPQVDKVYFIIDPEIKGLEEKLNKHLTKNPCDAVIVDSVSDLVIGDMNSQTVVRRFLEPFKRLSSKHDCLFIFMHHLTKSAKGNANKNQLNGSQAFEAKMRTVIVLSKPENYNSLDRNFQVVKGNYTSSEDKKKVVTLLFDEATLTFKRVGISSVNTRTPQDIQKYIKGAVIKMHQQKVSYRKISKILTNRGLSVSKTRVGEIVKESI